MSDNWRTEIDAEDYFGHQQKKLNLADRRPVIQHASDLVGPAIKEHAVTLTNFNNSLATYNGFFVAPFGAVNGPTGDGPFFGTVVADAEFGGYQSFTRRDDGQEWVRTFARNPTNPRQVTWGSWETPASARPAIHRMSHGAAFGAVTIPDSTPLALPLPSRVSRGLAGTFSAPTGGTSVAILRPGVYQGSLTLRSFAGGTTVQVFTPNAGVANALLKTQVVQLNDTANISFAFDYSGSAGLVNFTGAGPSGGSGVTTDDFHIVRVGPL